MHTFALFLIVSTGIAQTSIVNANSNLWPVQGTNHMEIMLIPQNGEVNRINQVDPQSSEVTQNLSEVESTINFSSNRSSGYTTALGLRGGYTSGISFKHFVSGNAAWELVVGSRWHGLSVTAIYELHKGNALGVSGMSWVYGIGARAGFYDGRYYYKGKKGCNDPNNPKCYDYYDRNGRGMTALGIVGIGGLEYKFKEIPFTISLDLIPVVYLNHYNNGFLDGSVSLRYIIK